MNCFHSEEAHFAMVNCFSVYFTPTIIILKLLITVFCSEYTIPNYSYFTRKHPADCNKLISVNVSKCFSTCVIGSGFILSERVNKQIVTIITTNLQNDFLMKINIILWWYIQRVFTDKRELVSSSWWKSVTFS